MNEPHTGPLPQEEGRTGYRYQDSAAGIKSGSRGMTTVRLKIFGSVERPDIRDGTKPKKWFNLKLTAESPDLREENQEAWRRGWDSNPRMEVLQTSPLGHLGTAPNL